MYEIDARSALRAFIRRITKSGGFTTAGGKVNLYAGTTRVSLQLRSAAGSRPIYLRYKTLRAAIQYAYYRRTVTRSDLEVFTKGANSALLGVLQVVFDRISRFVKTAAGWRLNLKGCRYFFAGVDRSVADLEVAVANGARFVLMSYFHIRSRKAWALHAERLGVKILLDSGAFSLWSALQKGKPAAGIRVAEYADFIEMHRDLLFAWFNLDVVGDAAASKENADYLKSRGLAPIEVWHAGGRIRDLAELVHEGLPVIAIGGSVGLSEKRRNRIFRWVFRCFPEQNFHFLGGASKLLWKFPWFSADSTSWIGTRKFGRVIDAGGNREAAADPVFSTWSGVERMAYTVRCLVGLEGRAA